MAAEAAVVRLIMQAKRKALAALELIMAARAAVAKQLAQMDLSPVRMDTAAAVAVAPEIRKEVFLMEQKAAPAAWRSGCI